MPREAIIRLCLIFNSCLKLGYFPTAWRLANVIPIAKPGKHLTKPESVRPISLLSNLGKVLQIIILKRIQSFADQHSVISNAQFGLSAGHSTVHQLVRVTSFINQAFKINNRLEWSCLMAIPFGTMALIPFGTMAWYINIIQCTLQNILSGLLGLLSQKENLENFFLLKCIIVNPEGSCLSTVLYNIYISDLPELNPC